MQRILARERRGPAQLRHVRLVVLRSEARGDLEPHEHEDEVCGQEEDDQREEGARRVLVRKSRGPPRLDQQLIVAKKQPDD